MNIKELAIQCGFIPMRFIVDTYEVNGEKIEAFAQAIALQAVAQFISEQKPVAWTITHPDGVTVDSVPDYSFYSEQDAVNHRDEYIFETCNVVPLYTLGGQP